MIPQCVGITCAEADRYMQGAQVTMDVLCGTSETGFAATNAVLSDNGKIYSSNSDAFVV